MGIGKAEAKVENIERKIYLKGTRLEIFDKFTGTVIGDVKSWNRYKLNPNTPGEPHYLFKIEERNDGVTTRANLLKYALVYNNEVHEVITRNEPEGKGNVLWEFRTIPNGEKIR